MTSTVLFQAPECELCKVAEEVELDLRAYQAWRAGMHAQDAFPDMTADEREVLISGTHPKCWSILMGDADSD